MMLRRVLLAGFVVLCSGSIAEAARYRVYIGSYTTGDSPSRGIGLCEFDAASGRLTEPKLAAELVNPSFLAIHPSGRFLYAVNEFSEGAGRGNGGVTAFRIGDGGSLTKLNEQPSEGGAPCHCNVDHTGRFLLVANYVGGNAAVFPIAEDGSLKPASSVVRHSGSSVDTSRQEAPHAHSINLSSDNRFAYVADLGIDRIMIYRFDSQQGLLVPNSPDSAAVTPGGGPRHFCLHPSGKFAYTNNELTCRVTAFRRNPQRGGLESIQEISTLPADVGADVRRSTAECLMHPTGRFVYVSNRGHDSIAVYRVDQDSGQLTLAEVEPTGGHEPRNFVIEPGGRWLLAENQNSDTIGVFTIDQEAGTLSPTGDPISWGRPVCIRLLSLD